MGLNDTDPSSQLTSEAQDAINVESSLSGNAIIKRKGYARVFSLTVATSPVNGSYSFVDPNGNRQDIICHDHYCAKSTNNTAFVVFVTSAGSPGIPTRWSFAQVGGTLYGANDKYDPIWSYDGTTFVYPASPTMPVGAVIEATKDRLVVGDISGGPNNVRYSQSGVYTNFTNGINSQDPYTDPIGASGDKVMALKYALGRLFIFKRSSITSCILGDQYTSRCYPVSNTLGTNDPNSIVEIPSGIEFRGNDRNYWAIDDSGFTLLTKKISNFVKTQTSGSSQSNVQTSQADWQAGNQSPSASWDTLSIAGSIFPSSFSFINNSTAAFMGGTHAGTGFNTNSIQVGAVPLSWNVTWDRTSLPDANTPPWVNDLNGGGACTSSSLSNGQITYGVGVSACSNADISGYHYLTTIPTDKNSVITVYAQYAAPTGSGGDLSIGFVNAASIQTGNNSVAGQIATILVGDVSIRYVANAAISSTEVTAAGLSYSTYTILVTSYSVVRTWRNGVFKSSASFSGSPAITGFWMAGEHPSISALTVLVSTFAYATDVADPGNVNMPTVSTFTSKIFDTTFEPSVPGILYATYTIGGLSSLDFAVRASTSPNNDMWGAWVVTPSSGNHKAANRYWQYKIALTRDNFQASPTVTGVSLTGSTTGQFRTQCIATGSNISSYGLLNCATATSGNGSLVFYATSAVSCAALPATNPMAWASVSNNQNLSIAVSSDVYIGFRSLLGASTDQAQIDACTLSWNNGVVAPPTWGTYDPIKNAVYWTTAINNSATNNRVLKHDLNLGQFYPFDLNANAINSINSTLYFGDSTGGYWNQYGVTDADNGAAINGYWVSKDIGAGLPFNDKTFNRISLVTKNQASGNLTVTYAPSNAAARTFNVSLSTTSSLTYVRANYNLPLLSPTEFMNLKFGNNSVIPFEIDGVGADVTVWPWKAQNP